MTHRKAEDRAGNKEDVQESDDDKPEARTFVHGLLEEANKWVRECEKSHTSCPFAHEPSLPTRVLDLEALESTATVRLMESHHQQCGCYVALSYVWGKTMPLRLVAKNRKALMNAIDIDKLPKTIRDAVRVTRALNVRYLWVDSLCILQDSDADKELQIPHMNAYYREAVVVISASGATDVHAGFLGFQSTEDEIIARAQSRLFADHPKYGPVPYSLGISWPENIRKNEVLCLIDVDPPLYDYNKEPINGRGWTLQESSLARRLLIFPGTGGIIMRCAKGESFAGNVLGNPFREEAGSLYHESGIIDKSGSEREKEVSGRDLVPSRATDEGTEDRDDKEDVDEEGGKHVYDNVDDSKRSINQDDNQNDENKSDEKSKKDREEYYNKLMFPETSREDKISQEWYAFVQDYSHRALSEPGDILIALGALAQQYQSQHDDVLGKYVAGLWTERLSEGLLWHLAYPRHQGRESFIQPRKEVSEHHAPSWSWASCGQPVTFHTQREPELAQFGIRNESYASKFDQPSWCIEIMGCSMMPRNEQFPFGAVQAAHIDVKGVLMPIRRVSGQVWSAHSTDRCAIDDLALLKADGSLPYHLSTDLFAPDSVKALEKIDDSCHWLPVYDAARSRARGLIVCELDSGLYQRLGFAQFDVGFDFSTKLEKKRVIRLI